MKNAKKLEKILQFKGECYKPDNKKDIARFVKDVYVLENDLTESMFGSLCKGIYTGALAVIGALAVNKISHFTGADIGNINYTLHKMSPYLTVTKDALLYLGSAIACLGSALSISNFLMANLHYDRRKELMRSKKNGYDVMKECRYEVIDLNNQNIKKQEIGLNQERIDLRSEMRRFQREIDTKYKI